MVYAWPSALGNRSQPLTPLRFGNDFVKIQTGFRGPFATLSQELNGGIKVNVTAGSLNLYLRVESGILSGVQLNCLSRETVYIKQRVLCVGPHNM